MAQQKTLFSMGKLVWTRGVNDRIADDTPFAKMVMNSLRRHATGDWGSVPEEDKETNDQALKDGDRLLSAYEAEGLPRIWIITEWDRSVTTVLFPDEY